MECRPGAEFQVTTALVHKHLVPTFAPEVVVVEAVPEVASANHEVKLDKEVARQGPEQKPPPCREEGATGRTVGASEASYRNPPLAGVRQSKPSPQASLGPSDLEPDPERSARSAPAELEKGGTGLVPQLPEIREWGMGAYEGHDPELCLRLRGMNSRTDRDQKAKREQGQGEGAAGGTRNGAGRAHGHGWTCQGAEAGSVSSLDTRVRPIGSSRLDAPPSPSVDFDMPHDESSTPLSRSVEDYLKAIYALGEQGEPASTSAIAHALDVQPASVSGMVKRLAESGFVEHERYRGVHLTRLGTQQALRIIRRHRVLETYLSERLGYSWDDVHDEAERLEHAASDDLIDRMAAALEHPSHDPHGAPIPTRAGYVASTSRLTLAEVPAGREVVIRAVRDDDPERLRYLETRGLLPGVRLSVEQRAPFNGPIGIRVAGLGGRRQTIGFGLADLIRVDEVDDGNP